MKKTVIGLLLVLTLSGVAAEAEPSSVWFNMGRGVVNLATCFLEVPRCLVYRNSQVPIWGIVGGACEGSGLTGVRALAGAGDLLSFGFMGPAVYEVDSQFKPFVWQSPWQAARER